MFRLCCVKVTVGLGFPMGMGLPWEYHGNGTEVKE